MLSVGRALSRQSHSDKELAETLHELQPNIYMNGNHKPEMALALTEFEALHGFIGLKVMHSFIYLFILGGGCVGVYDNFPY